MERFPRNPKQFTGKVSRQFSRSREESLPETQTKFPRKNKYACLLSIWHPLLHEPVSLEQKAKVSWHKFLGTFLLGICWAFGNLPRCVFRTVGDLPQTSPQKRFLGWGTLPRSKFWFLGDLPHSMIVEDFIGELQTAAQCQFQTTAHDFPLRKSCVRSLLHNINWRVGVMICHGFSTCLPESYMSCSQKLP